MSLPTLGALTVPAAIDAPGTVTLSCGLPAVHLRNLPLDGARFIVVERGSLAAAAWQPDAPVILRFPRSLFPGALVLPALLRKAVARGPRVAALLKHAVADEPVDCRQNGVAPGA